MVRILVQNFKSHPKNFKSQQQNNSNSKSRLHNTLLLLLWSLAVVVIIVIVIIIIITSGYPLARGPLALKEIVRTRAGDTSWPYFHF